MSTRLDFVGIVRAEWTEFRSVRSSVAALILLVVISVGFTGMILALTVSQWDQVDDAQRQQSMADPTRPDPTRPDPTRPDPT